MSEEKIIKGEDNIRYSATQVADMFEMKVSTIRYYMTAFENILDLEYSNKTRKFTRVSLRKLEAIIRLIKEDGMTIQQVRDYCTREDIFDEKGLIPQDKPLAMEILGESIRTLVKEEMDEIRSKIQTDIRNELKTMLEAQYQMNDILKKEVCISIDELVDEKLENHLEKTIEENKVIKEELAEHKKMLEEIKNTAYVSMEEIKKQKQEPPNRWFKRFMGWK